MTFGAGALLGLLGVVIITALLAAWGAAAQARTRAWLAHRGGGVVVTRVPSGRRTLAGAATLLLGMTLIVLAAARPQIGRSTTSVPDEGAAVVLAIDVSLSMAATDQTPDRLAVVRAETAALLDRLQGNRVGLVVFAGSAFPRFPLTRDLDAARVILEGLRPGLTFVAPGSDVAAAIEAARALLSDAPAAARAIIVVTDGEALQGDALATARAVAGEGIRLFTAGVGTPAGGTIPIRDPNSGAPALKVDAATGLPVVSRRDDALLGALAAAGRGRYVPLDRDGALSALAGDLAALQDGGGAVRETQAPVERFQWFAGAALLVLAAPMLPIARPVRPRRGAIAGAAAGAALLLAACATPLYEHTHNGNRLLTAGDAAAALTQYRLALADAPDDARLHLNAGQALHALRDYPAAEAETRRALTETDAGIRAVAWYHLGSHRLAAGDLVGARNAYIEALLITPPDFDMKFNLELVNRLLAERAQAEEATDAVPAPEPGAPAAPPESGQPDGETAGQDGEGPFTGAPGSGSPESLTPGPGGVPTPLPSAAPAPGSAADPGAALEAALETLNRDAPTPEQAFAVLDALRRRDTSDATRPRGLPPPLVGTRDW